MKRFLSAVFIITVSFVVGCKSSTGPVINNGFSNHYTDADGNVQMDPPPIGEGIQMVIEPFDVPRDSDLQGDFYFHLPSDVDFNVGRIEIAMNQGSHHMNLFRSPVAWPPDSGMPRTMVFTRDNGKKDTVSVRYQPQFNSSIIWNEADLMLESQLPYLNWALPKLPDGTQAAIKLGANDTLIAEAHYNNIAVLDGGGSQTAPNGKGKVIINLWKAPAGTTTSASMMFARKSNLSLPPMQETTVYKDCFFSPTDLPRPIYILGMTGHFHSRGKTFVVDKMTYLKDSTGAFTNVVDPTPVETIYRSAAWNEPPFTVYDTPIKLEQNQFIRYTVTYFNNTENTIVFGPHTKINEHCNLFLWFTPNWEGGRTLYDNQN
ncbi:MAG: hypothetical protein Q8916_01095 [Bacteroidota bacterium]|nr:hypothetical protein [Bacteroidota bacterium]MDP4228982.1 hypothetical protein [Bacteroidota bacterium]MDP4235784.1 hypothetical protein [Bacteroidota bacterium]